MIINPLRAFVDAGDRVFPQSLKAISKTSKRRIDIYHKPTADLQHLLEKSKSSDTTSKTTTNKYTPYYGPWPHVKPLSLYIQAKRDQDMDNNYRLALTSTRNQESWWRKLLRNVICLPLMLLSGYIILGIMFGVAVYTVGLLMMAGKYGTCRWGHSEWYCSRQMGNFWVEGR
ncbi:hypothetical protein B0T13DRAFT_212002 [Neurospora crassa]|nr:hypothetical protein B0T13DRAFT_212002 [Neurospora crassa]